MECTHPVGQSLERQTVLVALEIIRYNVDIAALSEQDFLGITALEINSRKEIAAVLDEEPVSINNRIMTMRLPLQRKMYVPTMIKIEEAKGEFFSDLHETIRHVLTDDRLILVGDFTNNSA